MPCALTIVDMRRVPKIPRIGLFSLSLSMYKEVVWGFVLAATVYLAVLLLLVIANLVRAPSIWILTLDIVRLIKLISFPLLYMLIPFYLFHIRFGSAVGWMAQTCAVAALLWLVAWLLVRLLRAPELRLLTAFMLGLWLLSLPVGEFIGLWVFLPVPYDEL